MQGVCDIILKFNQENQKASEEFGFIWQNSYSAVLLLETSELGQVI